MRTFLGFLALAAVSTAHAPASAKETGVEIAGRVSYGVPFGKIAKEATAADDFDMGHWFGSQIVPLQLDVGYRVRPRFFVGGYFSYGTVQVGEVCESEEYADIPCDSRDVRAGAEMTYHFSPPIEDAGWIGAGVGYEWLTLRQRVNDNGSKRWVSDTYHGLEVHVQAGYDFSASDFLRIGPHALVGVGRFSGISSEFEHDLVDGHESVPIDDKALHGWVMFGLKASFGPF